MFDWNGSVRALHALQSLKNSKAESYVFAFGFV